MSPKDNKDVDWLPTKIADSIPPSFLFLVFSPLKKKILVFINHSFL